MTVIAAYKLRNGCVLAVDGRVTADDCLVTDKASKFMVLGSCLVAFAGDLGPAQVQAAHWSSKDCKTIADLRKHRVKLEGDASWYCLVFDRRSQTLATLCSDGCLVEHKDGFASLGSGELVAWGYMSAINRPRSFKLARKALHLALQVTAAKVASCGGRVTFLTAQGKRKSVEFHTARC